MRIHKVNQNYLFGAGGVMLAGILGAMLFPAMPEGAHAEDVSQSAGTKVNLTVQPVIAVSAKDNAVSVDVTPTQGGQFEKNATTLSVSTNNETGYSLYLSTANGKSTLASLNPSVTDTIGAVSGTVEESDFGDNTWGYNLSDGNLSEGAPSDKLTYQAVPGGSTVQQGFGSEGPTASDTYTLTFGTKVNTSLPSGTYSNQVVVSVVANPAFVPVFDGIQTMQEMTSTICADAAENDTAQLTDTRDGKKYWVTKLADGNCWMTQNLDLDLGVKDGNTDTIVLTPADSDVSNNWTPPRSTEPAGTITSSNTFTETYSWDLGMYVKSDPDGYSSYCHGVKGLSDPSCTSAGWTDVSSMTPMTDGTTNEVISTDNNTYNAHYLVGNLYQWNAVTAGTGGVDVVGKDATDSICPKGWNLPTSNNSNPGSFGGLVGGLNSTTITQAPYYFNPGGYVSSGSLRGAGGYGYYWSSTADSSTSYAYFLYFYSGGVFPSRSNNRYPSDGLSVRCLASQ